MPKQYRVKCHETDTACRGMVKFNNSLFAVDGLLSGETAHIELVYGKNRQSTTAKLVDIEIPSPSRTKPFCAAFSRCGGSAASQWYRGHQPGSVRSTEGEPCWGHGSPEPPSARPPSWGRFQ